jgi:hypothetical protein
MNKRSLFFILLTACLLLALLGNPALKTEALEEHTYSLPIVMVGTPGPILAGCQIYPADHAWNTPIQHLPVDAHSTDYINSIGGDRRVHADFGAGLWEGSPIGIPYVVVPGSQPGVPISFEYSDESDPGLSPGGYYPIPPNPPIEGGSDRHMLILDQDHCKLYEIYAAEAQSNGSWTAGSGAVFDLNTYALRPAGWTSADAAGLPILPGLVRYDEVASGEIRHAIRFTAPRTRRGVYTWPARHFASSDTNPALPTMGQRFRLRADYNLSGFSPEIQVILKAMQYYGIILADNGSAWYLSGVPDERWDNTKLHEMDVLTGKDFEAVDTSSLIIHPDSGQARQR